MSRWDVVWEHLRWVYERAGREYTVAAAKWYEMNESWDLAGMTEKVRKAIEKKERK